MRQKPLPPQEFLLLLFSYDETTGRLVEKTNRSSRATKGMLVGQVSGCGLRQTQIDREKYYTSRIVWKMHRGFDPAELGRRNGDVLDDRVENLIEVSHGEAAATGSRAGRWGRGVFYVADSKSKPFGARLCVDGARRHLGSFATAQEARAAYDAAVLACRGPRATTNQSLAARAAERVTIVRS